MAHFAKLNSENIVESVLVVANEVLLDENNVEQEQLGIDFLHSLYGSDTVWVQTSFNANIRKQYAGIGFKYDSSKDKFISIKPYDSWLLDSNDDWVAPVDKPTDGQDYTWNEETQSWDLVE